MVWVSPVRRDVDGRDDQGDLTRRRRLSQPATHVSARTDLEHAAVHVGGAAGHGRPGIDVLLYDVFGEPLGRQHRDLPRIHVGLRGDAEHAAEMVDVAVGVDHRDHGPIAPVTPVQLQRRGRHLGGDQRIDHDQTGVPLDEADVRQVQSANLIDARHDFVEALFRRQHALPPQTRMHRRRCIARHEGVLVVVPHHPAVGGLDDARRQRADESPVGVGEVGGVVEWQLTILVCGCDGGRRRLVVHGIEIATITPASEETNQRNVRGAAHSLNFAETTSRLPAKLHTAETARHCRRAATKQRRTG